jgi:hypothetical protein
MLSLFEHPKYIIKIFSGIENLLGKEVVAVSNSEKKRAIDEVGLILKAPSF